MDSSAHSGTVEVRDDALDVGLSPAVVADVVDVETTTG